MSEKVVPMIHVPDVRATVEWYQSIGFTVMETYGGAGEGFSFGIISFGNSQVMFSEGGQSSAGHRREVDLYVYADSVDAVYERLKGRVDVVEDPHDTFYGMREFIIRDLNRFWITFGQPSTFQMLMTAVRERNIESVRAALAIDVEKGDLKPETLSAALAAATSGDNQSPDIRELLTQAGAVPPAEVDVETLQSYVGKYKGEPGIEFNVTLEEGRLVTAPRGQEPLRLMALNRTTFRPMAFDNFGIVTFNVEAGRTTGCDVTHGDHTMQLKRLDE